MRPPRIGELDRVGQQVVEHERDLLPIGLQRQRLRRQIDQQFVLFRRVQFAHGLYRALNHVLQRKFGQHQLRLALFDVLHVDHVVDQIAQAQRAVQDHIQLRMASGFFTSSFSIAA